MKISTGAKPIRFAAREMQRGKTDKVCRLGNAAGQNLIVFERGNQNMIIKPKPKHYKVNTAHASARTL